VEKSAVERDIGKIDIEAALEGMADPGVRVVLVAAEGLESSAKDTGVCAVAEAARCGCLPDRICGM